MLSHIPKAHVLSLRRTSSAEGKPGSSLEPLLPLAAAFGDLARAAIHVIHSAQHCWGVEQSMAAPGLPGRPRASWQQLLRWTWQTQTWQLCHQRTSVKPVRGVHLKLPQHVAYTAYASCHCCIAAYHLARQLVDLVVIIGQLAKCCRSWSGRSCRLGAEPSCTAAPPYGAVAGMQLYLQRIRLICMRAHRPWRLVHYSMF